MSSRPLKSIGNGALQELSLSEEDYLAYRAGIHLGQIQTTDASALTLDDTKSPIGSFFNTFYTGSGTVDTKVYALGNATADVDVALGVISSSITSSSLAPPPDTIQIGDKLTFTATINRDIEVGADLDNLGLFVEVFTNGVANTGAIVLVDNLTPSGITQTTGASWSPATGGNTGTGTNSADFTIIAEQAGSLVIWFSVIGSDNDIGVFPDGFTESQQTNFIFVTVGDAPGAYREDVTLDIDTDTTVNLGDVFTSTIIDVEVTNDSIVSYNQASSTNTAAYNWYWQGEGPFPSALRGQILVTGTGSSTARFVEGVGGGSVTLQWNGVAAPVDPNENVELNTSATTLYQNLSSVAAQRNDNDWRGIVQWDTTQSPPGIKEMSDAELDILVERLVKTIMENEYPGTFRLASSVPSGDWTSYLPNVFTDTRNDGTVQTYSIYIKSGMTSPAPAKPITIERSSGSTGTFSGLKQGSESVISTTLGERSKEIIKSTGIGTYQLRSSAQGAPTEPGVWVPRGIAVDTRNATVYSENVDNYFADYALDYIGNFIGDTNPTINFTQQYEDDIFYEGDFILDTPYEGDFILDIFYEGDFILDIFYEGDFTADFILDTEYEGDFIADYILDIIYEGDFIADFILDILYEGDFIADFILDIFYEGDFIADFILDIQYQDETNPTQDFFGETNPTITPAIQFFGETNPTIQYFEETNPTTNPTIQYFGETNPTTNPTIQYFEETNPTTNPTIQYFGETNPTIDYYGETNPTTNPTIQYFGETNPTIQYFGETNPTTNPTIQYFEETNPTIQYFGETNPTTNPTIQYVNETNPTINYVGNADFIGNADYIANYVGTSETNFTEPYLAEPNATINYIGNADFIANYAQAIPYIGDTNPQINYFGEIDYIGNFVGNVNYEGNTNPQINYFAEINYIGDFVGNVNYIGNTNPQINYQYNFDYIGDFVRDLQYFAEPNNAPPYIYDFPYIGDFIYTINYIGDGTQEVPYIGDIITSVPYNAEPTPSAPYVGNTNPQINYFAEVNYIGDFVGNVNYIGNTNPQINYIYNLNYIGDFVGNVNYIGNTNPQINYFAEINYIGNSPTTINYIGDATYFAETSNPSLDPQTKQIVDYIGNVGYTRQTPYIFNTSIATPYIDDIPYLGDFVRDLPYFAEPNNAPPYIYDFPYVGDFVLDLPYFAEPNNAPPYIDDVPYLGDFVRDVDYIGNFQGNVQYFAEPNATTDYIGTVKTAFPYIGDLNATADYIYNLNYIGDFVGNVNYVGNTNPQINYQYNLDYIGDFVRDLPYFAEPNNAPPYIDDIPYVGDFVLDLQYFAEPTAAPPYIGDTPYVGDFVLNIDYIGNAAGTAPFISDIPYVGDFIGNVDYIGDFLGSVSSANISIFIIFFQNSQANAENAPLDGGSVTYTGAANGGDTVTVTFSNALGAANFHSGIVAASSNVLNISGSAAGSTSHVFKINTLSPWFVTYVQNQTGTKAGTYYAHLEGIADNDSGGTDTTAPFVQATPYIEETDYIGDFILDTDYVGDFIADFILDTDFVGDFILDTDYEGDFIADFILDTDFVGDFILDTDYEGDFIADFILDTLYVGDFILDTDYEGDFIADFILDTDFVGDFIADFILDTDYVADFIADFILDTAYVADFILDTAYEGNFTGDFILDTLYVGDFILDILYEGNTNPTINYTQQYQDETNPTTNPVIQFQDETNPTTNPVIQFQDETNPTINFTDQFFGETNPTVGIQIQYQDETNPTIQFQDETNPTIQYFEETNPTIQFQDEIQYEGDFIADYILEIDYTANFTTTGATENFIGGEFGVDIGTEVTNIETYTLYCKINDTQNVSFNVWDTGSMSILTGPHQYAEFGTVSFRVGSTSYSTIYLEIDHVTSSNADFTTDVSSRIPVTLSANEGFTSIVLNEDSLLEGPEHFYARVWSSSTGGIELASAIYVTINDTSVPTVSYPAAVLTDNLFVVTETSSSTVGAQYIPSLRFESDGTLRHVSTPTTDQFSPFNATPAGQWIPDADKIAGIGSNYEINITAVSGQAITGETVGYVSLGTNRTVTGNHNNFDVDNQVLDSVVRIQIRRVGGSDDVDVNITLRSDTSFVPAGGAQLPIGDLVISDQSFSGLISGGMESSLTITTGGVLTADNTSFSTIGGSAWTGSPTWLYSGSAGDYDVRFDITNGSETNLDASQAQGNQWYNLATSRIFLVIDSSPASGDGKTASGQLQIRRTSDNVIVTQTNLSINAVYEA